METETKKINNRAIQNMYATYENKKEVEKALNLLKSVSFHESTYKFLSYFLHKNARGVTQAKVTTICKAVGIATSTYYNSVLPDLKSFEEPLIITIPTMKKGKTGVKNHGSTYKVLQPLSKIEKWIPKKQEEILQQHREIAKQITQ